LEKGFSQKSQKSQKMLVFCALSAPSARDVVADEKRFLAKNAENAENVVFFPRLPRLLREPPKNRSSKNPQKLSFLINALKIVFKQSVRVVIKFLKVRNAHLPGKRGVEMSRTANIVAPYQHIS
jgi:hypothetical protein